MVINGCSPWLWTPMALAKKWAWTLCCLLQGEPTACFCAQLCSPRRHTPCQCPAPEGQSCGNAALALSQVQRHPLRFHCCILCFWQVYISIWIVNSCILLVRLAMGQGGSLDGPLGLVLLARWAWLRYCVTWQPVHVSGTQAQLVHVTSTLNCPKCDHIH